MTGEEADRLFALAGEKYQAALVIKPDNDGALNNWGNALCDQAQTKTGEESDRLFKVAEEKLHRAEEIRPGSAACSLACLRALNGDEGGCRQWLEKAKQLGTLPSRKYLLNDPCLQSVREREWFKRLFQEADN